MLFPDITYEGQKHPSADQKKPNTLSNALTSFYVSSSTSNLVVTADRRDLAVKKDHLPVLSSRQKKKPKYQ